MPTLKWTARSFDFVFPAEMFPFILERLYGTAARITEITEFLSETQLTFKAGDTWSIKEHIGHLADLDELHEGRIDDYTNGLTVLRAADMQNKKTCEAHHNEKNIAVLIENFRKGRLHFIERLLKLDPQQTAQHPRLQKPMRVVDMAFFVAEHDDHHLAIVRELINH